MTVKLILAFYGSLLLAMPYYWLFRAKGRGSPILTTLLSVGFYIWMLSERFKTYDVQSIQTVFDNPSAYSGLLLEALIFIVLVYAIWRMAEGLSFKCSINRFDGGGSCEL